MAHEIVFDSIQSSNIPRREKSMIRKWAEKIGVRLPGVSRKNAYDAVEAVRAGGEAVLTGGALGAINAHTGLDYKTKDGHTVPLDAVGGAIALVGSAAMGNDLATDVRNIGTVAVGVASFRQGDRLMREAMLKSGKTPKGQLTAHGEDFGDDDMGDDPIERAARAL